MLVSKRTFLNAKGGGGHRTFADLELVRCEFTGSNLSQFDGPDLGLVVRDVTATGCVVKRSSLAGVRFENVLIDRLTTSSAVHFDGCAFRHVTLRGRVGSWMLLPPTPSVGPDMQQALSDGVERFYKDVDWALDISAAEFTGASLFYVPGELIRRDMETQYLLHRDSFTGVDLGEFPVRAQV